MGQENHVLDGGPDPPVGRGNFEKRKGRPIVKYRDTLRSSVQQVVQLWQRDRATHELLRFAKLRSDVFEPPFGGLREKVGALATPRWKARDRLPIS